MCNRQAVLSKCMFLLKWCLYILTGRNNCSFFPLVVWKKWRFQFIKVNHDSAFYILVRKTICEADLQYLQSLWKLTAVYLNYSVCRSTCLLGKRSFLSFCECEKQDLSADRALFSISINRCQHMPQAGLTNTTHRITFHQGW